MNKKLNWEEIKRNISLAENESNNFIVVVDEQGDILFSNAKMRQELKLENSRKVKNNILALLHPVHKESFQNIFNGEGVAIHQHPIELYLKNGQYHHMNWRVNRLTKISDGMKTFICLGSYKKENLLSIAKGATFNSEDENILNAFFENSTDLVWVIDEESNLINANQLFLEYFRLDRTDINKKIYEIMPLQVADALYDKHINVLQTGLSTEFKETGKLVDGTKVTFKIKLFTCGSKNGKKIVAGIAKDQSEKQIIKEKLEKVNERLINISRVSNDAIWEWDMLTGEIIRNERLTELTGYLPETQKGLAWWLGRVHPEDRNRLSDTLNGVTDQGLQSWESEYRFICADGEHINVMDRGFVIYEKGMPVKMIGSISDVTSQKLLENLLLEEKLLHYKSISESAIRVQEQERSRLGREMHDNVNQILSTIKLFLEMLTTTSKSDEDIKHKTIEYTLLAIEEIRKLSKEMVAPHLDGGSLADHINNLIEDIEKTTDIAVKFTHDNENDLLSPGKKLALYRIAQEQIKNILKYSKAEKLEILLYCKDEMSHMSIRDNGIGFDVKKTGSGIGLANIRERVRFYEGKTEIISSIGEGCQLNVAIPIFK